MFHRYPLRGDILAVKIVNFLKAFLINTLIILTREASSSIGAVSRYPEREYFLPLKWNRRRTPSKNLRGITRWVGRPSPWAGIWAISAS